MARPDASAAAEELYEALDPAFTIADEANDWVSLKICMALAAGRLDLLHGYLIDDETDRDQWAIVFDPTTAPVEALPYLAQFAGAIIRPSMDDEERRGAVQAPEVFSRGRLGSIEALVKRHLTGSKTVLITERYTLNGWRLRIETLDEETPDEDAIIAEVEELQKPIGIVLFFNKRINWVWEEAAVSLEYPTWEAVAAGFATWEDYRTYEP